MPEQVEACVRSIQADNPDMDEDTAYAICKDMKQKGALEVYLNADTGNRDGAALAEFRNPGDIQRVEEGDGTVRFKRVMLLSPGVWTDAGSEMTIDYSADGIRASAENWVNMQAVQEMIPEWGRLSNSQRAQRLADLDDAIAADAVPINLLHAPSMYNADSLDEVGDIPTDSVIVDDQGRLFSDLVFHGDTAQSQTAIDLMDEVLEAAQDPQQDTPPVGPSVEIPADHVEAGDRGVAELQEAWFSATGVVFNPASRPVELGTQARERAVAMQSADDRNGALLTRTLQDKWALHEPEFTGTTTREWDAPEMDDFETQDLDDISDHFLIAERGFPPAEFAELHVPVVEPEGDLNLNALREAKSGRAMEGVESMDGEVKNQLTETIDELAEQNFPRVEFGTEQSQEESDDSDPSEAESGETQTLKGLLRLHRLMGSENADTIKDLGDEEMRRLLKETEEDIGELRRQLQGEEKMAQVQDLIVQYQQEDGDLQNPVTEFVAWLEENAGVSQEEITDVLNAYLESVDAESLEETPVESLQGWLQEQGVGEDGGDGEGDDEGTDGPSMEDLQQAKQTIAEFNDHMEDIKDALSEYREETENQIESLERRLKDIENEPQQRSLAEPSDGEFFEAEDNETRDEHEEVML